MTPTPQRDDSAAQSPSEAVVEALADAKGVDPLELEPLYQVIDPDALDALFDGTAGGDRRQGRVEFRTSGYRVEVTASGRVHLTSLEALEASN
ncbi:HalOD1 output domain-containing protein [Natronoarchaeum rubrum]|mgnify:CR=1 FL=1|uniref:HalOD1 output domain-containing protein n=1 Tax=Natronoarchaeum rubrum TaxID=755311 RepID=UPI00211134D3|nr:HalOD1 output domain-containing protein [Natronoarchaeum rubrum]HMB50116.1 HalOD1 output domain-containing protein [Natronoarchaeum rubrum]